MVAVMLVSFISFLTVEPLLKLFCYDVSLKIEGNVKCLAILFGLATPYAGIVLLQATHVDKTASFKARSRADSDGFHA
jgi:hypothetical protein